MTPSSLDPGYFDALYESDPDPWRFETSSYEAEKYAATIAALPRAYYRSAIEIGCSIGVLTQIVAARCGAILGIDVAQAAIDKARARCADLGHIDFAIARFPDDRPAERYDLIILSEILYYFDDKGIAAAAETVRKIALSDADIICVHWLGPTPDYPKNGDQAVDAFEAEIGPATIMLRQRKENYRLDVFRLPQDERSAF
ncbi:MAG: SAM-dependent methyltransferase [Sphingorhabdus sp.]